MSDDIVTRLRNWHDQHDSWQTLTEAAEEIERLRNELAQAKKPKDIWHDCSHCQGHEPEAIQ